MQNRIKKMVKGSLISQIWCIFAAKTTTDGSEIRCHSDWRRTCGMRGSSCCRANRRSHFADHNGHEQNRADVMQSGRRRNSKGADCQGNRCAWRCNGPSHGCYDHTIPYAQPFQRPRHVESTGSMRPSQIHLGMARSAGEHTQPAYLARPGTAANHRLRSSGRSGGGRRHWRRDLSRHDFLRQEHYHHGWHVPERTHAYR